MTAAAQLPEALSASLLSAARWAFVQGIHLNGLIGLIGFIGLAYMTATVLRYIEPHGEDERDAESGGEQSLQSTAHQPKPEAITGD